MKKSILKFAGTTLALVIAGLTAVPCLRGAEPVNSQQKQRELLEVLQSGAPADKALACKNLAIYGNSEAVPALAPLLADEKLASWARIALEAIPGEAADAALREAAGKLQGNLLVGAINSIGVRRDARAIQVLTANLQGFDAEPAGAAAIALGKIGGPEAAKALRAALEKAPPAAAAAFAEGCIRCAENFLKSGKAGDAEKLYDLVRKASVPKQKVLEATRGAILARGNDGVSLLVEQLRSPDWAFFGIGLRTARELPGGKATDAVAAEIGRASEERQPLLLLALGDRSDKAALAAVVEHARKGPKKLRLTSVGILEKLGNPSTVPVLIDAAASGDPDLKQAASAALVRMPGDKVDGEVLFRLPETKGKTRQVLLYVAGQRRIDAALPAMLTSTEDKDPEVRSAAVQALSVLGDNRHTGKLVKLLESGRPAAEQAEIETALLAICSRAGGDCVPDLLSLAKHTEPALRIAGLHALAAAGGSQALGAVKTAISDKDPGVQDEAARTLSTWPNTWPEDGGIVEPLLTVLKSEAKLSHKVLALRGYLQYVQGDRKLKDDRKVALVKDAVPFMQRPEEKRQAMAVLQALPTASSLELIRGFASDPALAEDAYTQLVALAGRKSPALAAQPRQQALQLVIEKSQNEETRKKAEEKLKALQ